MHKIDMTKFVCVLKLVAFIGKMPDTGCQMPVFQDYSKSEIEKHQVSRCQNPASANAGKGFRRNDLDEMQYFMQL